MKTVTISDRNYTRLAKYAKVAKISTQRAINDACKEWMDSDGDRLVAFIKRNYRQDPAPAKRTKAAKAA